MIHIGHPDHSGINRLVVCKSKAEAIRELRERGLTRDRAREIVKDVCANPNGFRLVAPEPIVFDIIEVANVAE